MNISCDCQSSRPSPKKLCCPKGVEIDYVELPASLGTSAPGQPNAPENGAYKNAVVKYVADGHVYIYTSEGIPVLLSDGSGGGGGDVISVNGKTGEVVLTTSDLENDSDYQTGDEVVSAIENAISQLDIPTNVSELTNDAGYQTASEVASAVAGEATLRQSADNNLQTQIDAISASSDVTDIVGTYAELQAYDTSTLGDKDIIKVLQDESRNDETTYYRWSTTTQTFTLIGEEGPYYTKSQADGRFVAQTTYTTDKAALEAAIGTKQDELTAGNNIQISGSVISATDTTYSDFTGTDGQTAGTAGLVPAPATTDADKFLKSDGTWDTVAAGPTVVQTTGTSTTDVMSQDATTKMIWPAVADARVVSIGGTTNAAGAAYSHSQVAIHGAATGAYSTAINGRATGTGSIAIGENSNDKAAAADSNTIAIGGYARASSFSSIAIGASASTESYSYSIALGTNARNGRQYEVSLGRGGAGDPTRFLANVTDPALPQDAATKNYVDNVVISFAAISGATAPTTATEGKYVGQLYYDTTNDTMYYLSSIDDTQTPVEYNWSTFGGGGGFDPYSEARNYSDIVIPAGTNYASNNTAVYISPQVSSGTNFNAQNRSVNILGKFNRTWAQTVQVGYGAEATGTAAIAIGASNAAARAVAIGSDYTGASGDDSIAIGQRATTNGNGNLGISMGCHSSVTNVASLAFGYYASASGGNSVALGREAKARRTGEVNIGTGTTTNGYNSTSYRVLGGVHAAVDTHDAVNLEQMNARILAGGTAAPTTSTIGEVGALYAYVENGTGHLAICTAADASTSTYTWQTLV